MNITNNKRITVDMPEVLYDKLQSYSDKMGLKNGTSMKVILNQFFEGDLK